MTNQQLSNQIRQTAEDRISVCIECGVCATILCFSTFMGIVAFVVLAVIAAYLGDPKNYAPYSILFISMFIGSVICKLYTRYHIKGIRETERVHRLNQVEETVNCETQLNDIHPFNAMAYRNYSYSGVVPEVEITETESVKDEAITIEDYPAVIYHGDTVEYVFGPLPTKRFVERRNVSKNASNTFDMQEVLSEQPFHQTDAITITDSLNFNEEMKERIQTHSLKTRSHRQTSSLRSCTVSLYPEKVSISEVESVEMECITGDNSMVIPSGDTVEHVLGRLSAGKSSEKSQESSNGPNTPVVQELITRQFTQFYPYDTLAIANSVDSDGECSNAEIGNSIRTQSQKHLYSRSVTPCSDALYSENVAHGEMFRNESLTSETPVVIYHSEAFEQELRPLRTEKSINEKQELKNCPNTHSSQKIITQQVYQSDSIPFRDSMDTDEELYSGYETDENVIEENEDYPVVKYHGDSVEYIFGPLPARMLEERRKLMHTEGYTDVSRT